ncbi:hypothetical protein L2Y96_18870 [Luteibacter aegosomaticola]|uniref:hypothetical protein n=1 Tax=Luteibacter aegosomaticola TaxID=2911538 RepID=UPI001FF80F39|nr:hypothetical protein [Luteibacter aegosomaticola]UPG89434.1 hypothetical protein L2Y96_18870 [Luteibacter aegosomaticola]
MLTYKPIPELAGPLYGKEPWPLRFHAHTFDAWCMNTLACSVVYGGIQFGNRKFGVSGEPIDSPALPPSNPNWRETWRGFASILGRDGQTFPSSIVVDWLSLDGGSHAASIDLNEIFPDRLVLHRVDRTEVKEAWLAGVSMEPVCPSILLEINDRTIRIYMRALIVAEDEQGSDNQGGHLRNDLVLAWEHVY